LVGADQIILPEEEGALKVADSLTFSYEVTRINDTLVAGHLRPPRRFVGKSLADLALEENYGVTCSAIRTPHGTLLAPVSHSIDGKDPLICVGTPEALNAVARL
jgi:Trk K+ transport system NAD-binding subunit